MRRWTTVILLVVLALVGAACGGDDSDEADEATTQEETGAATRTVKVDGTSDKFNAAFLAYFPKDIQVRPGDTVDFKEIWTGEPHSVTMGTLVEAGLTAAKAAPPNADPPPAFASLPTMFTEGPNTAANQNGAQPCFLTSEKPPTDIKQACPKVTQPPFNGKQSYYNSGFLPEGKTFSVKLADDIAPGTYNYYCNLHELGMTGTITVKPKDATIPSQADVDRTAKSELDAIVNQLLPGYEAAKTKIPIEGATALAGQAQDDGPGLVDEFIKPTIDVKVGDKVTWAIIGPHTISFNAEPSLQNFLTVGPDGTVTLKSEAFGPAGGPPFIPPESSGPPPSGPPKLGKVLDHGRWDGTGFKSSGFVPPGPPPFGGYSLTFTNAGTYNYVCLIHPKMGGIVRVT